MFKKIFRSDNLSQQQKEHKKRIKSYSRDAYNIRANIIRFRPTQFEKYAIQISNHLMSHDAAIVDFSELDTNEYQKLLYFISGTVYCLGGSMDRVGDNDKLFLITSSSVNVKDEEFTQSVKKASYEEISNANNSSLNNANKQEQQKKELASANSDVEEVTDENDLKSFD